MPINVDPSRIKTKFGIAAAIVVAFESLFFLWFKSATDSTERIVAGVLAAIVLIIFLYRTFSKGGVALDPNAKKLVGRWNIESTSNKGKLGTGTLTISCAKGNLSIAGVLFDGETQIGTFSSEVTRVNENRLVFYYVLRDQVKRETMDAVSIVVFDPGDPNELNGDWIVASKTPHHGSVKYTRAQ